MGKIEDIKSMVDGLKNGLFENVHGMDELFTPEFEWLISRLEIAEIALIQCRAYNNSPKYDGIRITTLVDETLDRLKK
jgi:transcription termination factor NusB